MPYNCISEIFCTRQRRYMEHTINDSNLLNLTWSLQDQCIKWADTSILDRSTTFLLNLLHNNFPDSALYTAQPTHFDDGEPIWLLILMCTMAGEPELTPAPAVYRYDGEDVVWTWRLGKYRQVSASSPKGFPKGFLAGRVISTLLLSF